MSRKSQPIHFFDRKVTRKNCVLILEVQYEALNFILLRPLNLIHEVLNYEDELFKILIIQLYPLIICFLVSRIHFLCILEDSFHVNEMHRFVLNLKF